MSNFIIILFLIYMYLLLFNDVIYSNIRDYINKIKKLIKKLITKIKNIISKFSILELLANILEGIGSFNNSMLPDEELTEQLLQELNDQKEVREEQEIQTWKDKLRQENKNDNIEVIKYLSVFPFSIFNLLHQALTVSLKPLLIVYFLTLDSYNCIELLSLPFWVYYSNRKRSKSAYLGWLINRDELNKKYPKPITTDSPYQTNEELTLEIMNELNIKTKNSKMKTSFISNTVIMLNQISTYYYNNYPPKSLTEAHNLIQNLSKDEINNLIIEFFNNLGLNKVESITYNIENILIRKEIITEIIIKYYYVLKSNIEREELITLIQNNLNRKKYRNIKTLSLYNPNQKREYHSNATKLDNPAEDKKSFLKNIIITTILITRVIIKIIFFISLFLPFTHPIVPFFNFTTKIMPDDAWLDAVNTILQQGIDESVHFDETEIVETSTPLELNVPNNSYNLNDESDSDTSSITSEMEIDMLEYINLEESNIDNNSLNSNDEEDIDIMMDISDSQIENNLDTDDERDIDIMNNISDSEIEHNLNSDDERDINTMMQISDSEINCNLDSDDERDISIMNDIPDSEINTLFIPWIILLIPRLNITISILMIVLRILLSYFDYSLIMDIPFYINDNTLIIDMNLEEYTNWFNSLLFIDKPLPELPLTEWSILPLIVSKNRWLNKIIKDILKLIIQYFLNFLTSVITSRIKSYLLISVLGIKLLDKQLQNPTSDKELEIDSPLIESNESLNDPYLTDEQKEILIKELIKRDAIDKMKLINIRPIGEIKPTFNNPYSEETIHYIKNKKLKYPWEYMTDEEYKILSDSIIKRHKEKMISNQNTDSFDMVAETPSSHLTYLTNNSDNIDTLSDSSDSSVTDYDYGRVQNTTVYTPVYDKPLPPLPKVDEPVNKPLTRRGKMIEIIDTDRRSHTPTIDTQLRTPIPHTAHLTEFDFEFEEDGESIPLINKSKSNQRSESVITYYKLTSNQDRNFSLTTTTPRLKVVKKNNKKNEK